MFRVKVEQGDNIIFFGFNTQRDALDFVEDCIECGDDGTRVEVYKEED